MSNPADRVEIIIGSAPSALGSGLRRFGWSRRPSSRADGTLGGSPTWRCPKPALHLAPAGGRGGAAGRRQRRAGGAGVGLSGFAEPGVRVQRLLGKKTLEAEILKEALEHATG